MIKETQRIGLVNGPSKTLDLKKDLSCSLTYFNSYACLTVSIVVQVVVVVYYNSCTNLNINTNFLSIQVSNVLKWGSRLL